jgi:hypothetical protein
MARTCDTPMIGRRTCTCGRSLERAFSWPAARPPSRPVPFDLHPGVSPGGQQSTRARSGIYRLLWLEQALSAGQRGPAPEDGRLPWPQVLPKRPPSSSPWTPMHPPTRRYSWATQALQPLHPQPTTHHLFRSHLCLVAADSPKACISSSQVSLSHWPPTNLGPFAFWTPRRIILKFFSLANQSDIFVAFLPQATYS